MTNNQSGMPSTESRLPIPDPTTLTTDQLRREIGALREIIEAQLASIEQRIDLIQEALERRQHDIDATVSHLRTLHEEKFHSISVQFAERDTRTEQTSRDSKVAVDAALQAAKEAVGEQNKSSALAIAKSEAATTKQIDQMAVILNTTAAGLNDKIDDIKTRITQFEARTEGISSSWATVLTKVEDVKTRLTQIEGHSKGIGDSWGIILGAIGVLLAIGTFATLIITKLN